MVPSCLTESLFAILFFANWCKLIQVQTWIEKINTECLDNLQKLSQSFKFIVSTTVVQKNGAGIYFRFLFVRKCKHQNQININSRSPGEHSEPAIIINPVLDYLLSTGSHVSNMKNQVFTCHQPASGSKLQMGILPSAGRILRCMWLCRYVKFNGYSCFRLDCKPCSLVAFVQSFSLKYNNWSHLIITIMTAYMNGYKQVFAVYLKETLWIPSII